MTLSVVVIIKLRVNIFCIINCLKRNEPYYHLNDRRLIINEGANKNNQCKGLLKVFIVFKLNKFNNKVHEHHYN